MSTASRAAVAALVGGGVLLAAGQVPRGADLSPAASPAPVAAEARPVERAQAACPGPDRLGVDGSAPVPMNVRVWAAAPPAAVAARGPGAGGRPQAHRLRGGAAGVPVQGAGPWDLASAESLLVTGEGADARGTTALQLHGVTGGEQRVLAAAGCGPAARDVYLVAGGPQPGRQERLVLVNPAAGAATVDVSVLDGSSGRAPEQDGQAAVRHVVVPAQGRTALLLDAVAPGAKAPVVHVRASTGAVRATLSDSWLDGVTPRGGDDALPTLPARDLVVPGVVTGRGGAWLRLGVPGEEDAVVEVRAWTKDGQRGLATPVTRVPAGGTAEVGLSTLPAGTVAVQVHADVPVVAGAFSAVTADATHRSDIAWTTAAGPVRALAGTALPGRPAAGAPPTTASLVLAAERRSEVRVVQVDAQGKEFTRAVTVPQTGTVEVPVEGASAWVLPQGGEVHAALLVRADADGPLLSVVPLAELPLRERVVAVRQG